MKIYSFTFARSGSKGIKNKNLKTFNKRPLISWAIKDSLNSKFITKAFVSTDSKKIAATAKKAGAIVPFLRPKKLSTSTSPEYLSWQHAIKFLKKQKDLPDLFVSVPCTSPLRTSKDLDNMITLFIKEKADFVVGICDSHRSPYFNLMKKNHKKLVLFSNLKKKIFRRQDTPKTFDLTTFAYIAKPDYILNKSNFYSGKSRGYYISDKFRSIDIDTLEDLEYAEFLNKKYGIK
jgi:N,N'-diacetyl-8-epilegionaminate cytidylyltransferase